MENPYCELITLIRQLAQAPGKTGFIVVFSKLDPITNEPIFSLDGQELDLPFLYMYDLTFLPEEIGSSYLCLPLDSRYLIVCKIRI